MNTNVLNTILAIITKSYNMIASNFFGAFMIAASLTILIAWIIKRILSFIK